jgi:hypothetical protein
MIYAIVFLIALFLAIAIIIGAYNMAQEHDEWGQE